MTTTILYRPDQMRFGVGRVMLGDAVSDLYDTRRENTRLALEIALEEKAARRAEDRQREILEQTQKAAEMARAAQGEILTTGRASLDATLQKTQRVAIIAVVSIGVLRLVSMFKRKKPKSQEARPWPE